MSKIIYHNHHITPRCLLKHKSNDFINHHSNIVRVTLQHHIALHKWLCMITGDEKCQYAYNLLSNTKRSTIEWTPERRKKLSNSCKGKTPWNKGKTNIYSEETINKMRLANLGKTYTKATNKKKGRCGSNNAFYGKSHSEESITKMRKSKSHLMKPIIVDNVEYPSIREAHSKLNISKQLLIYRLKSINFPNYQYKFVS